MGFVKDILKILVSAFAPIILVFAGAGIIGIGLDYQWAWLVWTGLVAIVCGLIWGLILFLYSNQFSIFD